MTDDPRTATSEEPAKRTPVPCPHCGGEVSFELVAKYQDQSRIRFDLHAAPGELMSAKHVGEALSAMGDLMRACAKEVGVPTEVLVERIETTADGGGLHFHLLVIRFETVAARKLRIKKSKESAEVSS